MNGNRLMRWLACLFVTVLVFCGVAHAQKSESAQQQIQRQQTQPGNNAPVWRDVRSGENPYQTTQVRGNETAVLIQSGGETWRQTRRVFTYYGGWVLAIVPLLIGLFYWRKGAIKLKEKPTGRTILRFTNWQRTVHWTVAITFCLLALSGLVMLFGKYILMPVFGRTLFSWLAILCKNLHNFAGPVFAIGVVVMLLTFIKDNFIKAYDMKWFAKFGGILSGEHIPSGRFNAGEKVWFWVGVMTLGIVVSVTGFILDFPNFSQGREAMQQANVIHAIAAMIFIALFLGHAYMGTIGTEGAYQAMRRGVVDETWAKEHHEIWYQEIINSKSAVAGAQGAAIPAPVKEG
jgi:formate dehydrogenase subunit gamma